jgi:hypothetical protein
MDKLSRLIAEAIENSPNAGDAQRQLAALGAPAVGRIFEEVKSGNVMVARRLAAVVTRALVAESVPAALGLLSSADFDHFAFALAVIANSNDRRAVQPLIDFLCEPGHSIVSRRMVADALGDLRGSEALAPMLTLANNMGGVDGARVLAQARDEYDYDQPQLLLSLVRAAAKLGDHALAPLAVFFADREPTPDDDPEAAVLRIAATETLKFSVTNGMIAALHSALHDRLDEVRRRAMDALLYLGVGAAGADFLMLADDPGLGHDARVRFSELTGAPFSDSAEPLRKHRAQHGGELRAGTCWRLGEPIWLPQVIEVLSTPAWRQVIPELRIRIGEDFSFAASPYAAARAFWDKEGERFPRGALSKFGHVVTMPSV